MKKSKARLFSVFQSDEMNTQNPIVCFQFSDSFTFDNNNWDEKLKWKMRKSNNKQVYFGHSSGSVSLYELSYDKKTQEFSDLRLLKFFEFLKPFGVPIDYGSMGILIDKERNELLSIDYSYCAYIWNLENYQTCSQNISFDTTPMCAFWYHDKQKNNKKYLIVGFEDGNIQIWDWKIEPFCKSFKAHTRWIRRLIVNEEEQELLTCGDDNLVKLWCLKTFTLKRAFIGHGSSVMCICFINKQKTLFACEGNGCITIWNKEIEKCILKRTEHYLRYTNSLYSFDLGLLITCSGTQVKCWSLTNENKEMELKFLVENPFNSAITRMAFLDPVEQTQILIVDEKSNLFIVDLLLKRIIWKMKDLKIPRIDCVFIQ